MLDGATADAAERFPKADCVVIASWGESVAGLLIIFTTYQYRELHSSYPSWGVEVTVIDLTLTLFFRWWSDQAA